MWTLEPVVDMIEEMKVANEDLRAYAVLNGVDAQGNEDQEAKDYIIETVVLTLLDSTIGRRKAFRKAASQGLSVIEFKPADHKAIGEMRAFFEELERLNTPEKTLLQV